MLEKVLRSSVWWSPLRFVVVGILTLSACAAPSADLLLAGHPVAQGIQACSVGEAWARTELFFGRSRPDGSIVTDTEWQGFLDQVITPRFPDGLTVLMGKGQFRDRSGVISREDAVLVILFYPTEMPDHHQRLESIREAYKQAFQQQSVLRVDTTTCADF